MLRSYLLLALRTLKREKGYALINLLGLVLGLACCLLIGLYVLDELSFDRFHEDGDRIFRVSQAVDRPDLQAVWASAGGALGEDLVEDFPQIEALVRLHQQPSIVRADVPDGARRSFREPDILYVDASFFDVFTFPLLQGDPATALADPSHVVLTASTARKYFGTTDVVGQTLHVEYGDRTYTVAAVAEDVPTNSHLRFDLLLPMTAFKQIQGMSAEANFGSYWWPSPIWTYARLPDAGMAEALQAQMPAFAKRHREEPEASEMVPLLEPLYDLRLRSEATGGQAIPGTQSDLATVRTFGAIALAVLLLACVNFTNLATARARRRAKEVGVRKSVGAQRTQLVVQFLGETVLLSLVALVLALGLVQLLLPAFGTLVGRPVDLAGGGLAFWLGLLGLVVLTGLAAGAYPALYLSGFRPAVVLKGTHAARGGARLRQGLVVFQFAVCIALIAGTAVALLQLRYLQTARLGFDREAIVSVRLQGGVDWPALQQTLEQTPGVEQAIVASVPPGVGRGSYLPYQTGPLEAPDEDPSQTVLQFVGDGYFEMLGVDLVAGRVFGPEYPADRGHTPEGSRFFYVFDRGIVVNEAAARANGWTPETALGQSLRVYTYENGTYYTDLRGTVVGVVEDFHHSSLRQPIEPMMFTPSELPGGYYGGFGLVKVAPGAVAGALERVETAWRQVAPDAPFEATFLDDELAHMYAQEARLSKILGVFALVSLAIACLGLLGLAAYAAEQRTKEIGIRKVLGASSGHLVRLLSRDFLWLIGLAALVAIPLAWWIMHAWLEAFAYRIALHPGPFVATALGAIVLGLLVVSGQAFRAARRDPVCTLRYE